MGDVLLRNVYLEAPDGGSYIPGDDATLRLRIINKSTRDDQLRAVRAAAEQVRIRWDRDCDGRFEAVDRLPLRPEGPVPYSDAYFVEFVGIDRVVRAGTTLPVTFEFQHAGVGTVDAMVEGRRDGSRGSRWSCEDSSDTSPRPGEGDVVTVTGSVVAGVEPSCLLLDTGVTRYLLSGADSPLLEPGSRLTVWGIAHPGTHHMYGGRSARGGADRRACGRHIGTARRDPT
jgi:hypothetical protein